MKGHAADVALEVGARESAPGPDGILVVVPPGGAGRTDFRARVVSGLPIIRRIVLTATAAGYRQILVRDIEPETRHLLDDTAAGVLTAFDTGARRSRQRVVALPSNVIPQPLWLRSLREMPLDPEKLYVDETTAMVVETERADLVMAAAARSGSAAALLAELRDAFETATLPGDPDGRFQLVAGNDARRAETWLLRSLIKHNEGFMSRHFERRVSLALTRRLANTSVSPNAMTLVSLAIGLAGAPWFLSSTPTWQLVGSLLFLTHSILDGCDGELARLKFQQSRVGAVLDFWGDNLVHVAVFAAMAIGWSYQVGQAWPLVLGGMAIAGTLGSAAIMFRYTAEDRALAAGESGTARMVGKLANRDFIYVVILAAAFGKAAWFLAVAAVGTPLFCALAFLLHRRHGRPR